MHWYELLPLALLALLVFGPKRLPEMGASIGKTIREFQKSMHEITGGFDAPSEPVAKPAPAALPAPSPAEPAAVEAAPATVTPVAAAQTVVDATAEPVSATASGQPGAEA